MCSTEALLPVSGAIMRKFNILVVRYYVNPYDEKIKGEDGRFYPQYRAKMVNARGAGAFVYAKDEEDALQNAKRMGVVAPILHEIVADMYGKHHLAH